MFLQAPDECHSWCTGRHTAGCLPCSSLFALPGLEAHFLFDAQRQVELGQFLVQLIEADPLALEVDDQTGGLRDEAVVVFHQHGLGSFKVLAADQEGDVGLNDFGIGLLGFLHLLIGHIIQLASPTGVEFRCAMDSESRNRMFGSGLVLISGRSC